MLDWEKVVAVHGTVTGISVREGRATSILCNPGKTGRYPDRVGADRITYFVNGDTPQRGITALLKIVGTSEPVRVFEKVGVNRWRDLGIWIATEVGDPTHDGYVAFTLVKAQ